MTPSEASPADQQPEDQQLDDRQLDDRQLEKRQAVLDILAQSDTRLSAQEYIKQIKKTLAVSSRSAKKLLKNLINDQELSYHYLYGTTYVEHCFLKPVKITEHFILQPPGFSTPYQKDATPIILHQGISFGSGQHPTTQLCLAAIEYCFFEVPALDLNQHLTVADIGTGSGVLAFAMCLPGRFECKAHEIDPVSVNETKKNIKLNKLEKKIQLYDTLFQGEPNTFSMICANLRWPTLKSLKDIFYSSLKDNGIAVLSGVRIWEKEMLLDTYCSNGFELFWQKDEKEWSAFVLIKKTC